MLGLGPAGTGVSPAHVPIPEQGRGCRLCVWGGEFRKGAAPGTWPSAEQLGQASSLCLAVSAGRCWTP